MVHFFILLLLFEWMTYPFSADDFRCEDVVDVPQGECLALTTLYLVAHGSEWSHQEGWLANNSVCDWYGVSCEDGHIVELILNNNQLAGAVPNEIENLTFLRLLDLGHNQIDALAPTIGRLSRLKSLQLLHNNLSQLPVELNQLTNLENLNLFGNQLNTLPDSALPPQLSTLSLGSNLLTELPDSLWGLDNLIVLDLSENQLTNVSEEIGRLSQLRYLLLTKNPLLAIPPTISQLTQLNVLLLGYTSLTTLPEDIFPHLTQLTILTINYTQLTTLPSDLVVLPNLQELYLQGSTLEGDWLTPLSSLTTLRHFFYDNTNICRPETAKIESWLAKIVNVQHSGISCNQIVDPASFCATQSLIPLNECHALSDLYLATGGLHWQNDIGWFRDDNICNWYGLKCRVNQIIEINLPNNQLQGVIPDSIGTFSALERLDWSGNQLQSIPIALFQNHGLISLNLSHNLLQEIDPQIIELWALQSLDLNYNQLKSLPIEIGGLSFLEQLDISNNISLSGEIPRTFINLNLTSFAYEETMLCEPGDEIFTNWFDRIGIVRPNGEGNCQQPPPPFCSNIREVYLAECGALFAIYNETQGEKWHTLWENAWFTSYTPCSWSGIVCENGHIVSLSLENHILIGAIPSEIEALQWLKLLNLANNQITTVPNGIGRLPVLRSLSLQNNAISHLPDLSGLQQLETLSVGKNPLTGSYPFDWMALPFLTTVESVSTDLCIPHSSYGRWIDSIQFTGSENWCSQSIFLPIILR